MKIYNSQGAELLDIKVDDTSVRYRSIMQDDSLTLKFSHTTTVAVPVGSYVEFEGQRYTLWLPENFKKHNTRNFEYTITLGGWREALKLFKFKDLSAMPYRLKFSLTASPKDFLKLIVDNMNVGDSGWTAGSYVDAPEKTISFKHEYVFDVINRIAQEFTTEWEIENKTIHLRKVEKFKDDPLALSYGKGNGFKSGVGRANDGDNQPIGRLYVQGGERNIDFSTYGSTSLLLPKSATLVYDGKTFRSDAHGMYIARDGNNLLAEGSFDANHIYPKRVGTVSEVAVVDAEKHFYDIKDASIPELLDYSECRIEGEKATISFQSGALAGREFDIEQTDKALTGYVHAERLFKIVPQELDGIVMPGGAFVPAVGDKYAIFNISMPESYIEDNATKTGASWEMFEECVKYFAENEKQKFNFTGELDGIWAKSKWLEIGGKIVPGGHVNFSDTQFLPNGEVVRIISVKDYVNFPHKPEITLSNAPIPGGLGSQLGGLEAGEVVIEDNYKKGQLYTKRRWRDLMETMGMLEDGLLNFDKSINPITIRTMQLIVGDESLQFRFVNNKTNPQTLSHTITFDTESKILTASSGIIQHMTLGIKQISTHKASDYLYWNMGTYQSPPLDPSKSYYLYAKCSKTAGTGTFLLSETAIEMQSVAGYYHFLVAIVNSESADDRSIVTMYGFSEILPGRITTDKIASGDGKTYFDLVESVIAGNIKFLSNGVENDLGSWADNLNSDLSGLNSQVSDFEAYLEGAFRDGVISEAEAKAIEAYINTIKSEKSAIEATYNKLFVNPLLTGVAKSNLLNSKISFYGEVNSLISLINSVIADGEVTPAEKSQVDYAFDDYRASYALFSQRIQEASDAIQSAWGAQLQGQIDGVDDHVGNLESYLEDAFKDGIISEAEAKAIQAYINIIKSEKSAIEATYNKLFVNSLLTGVAKSNLLNSKINFYSEVDTLIDLINSVIADGEVTPAERSQVDNAFESYRTAYALFSQRIQEAYDAIQEAITSSVEAVDAKANISKAITDKFGTTVNGGLVNTVMMLLREFNSTQNTAGISGIQGVDKNNPAFWAGGEYAEAIALIDFLSKMSAGTAPDSDEYVGLAKITMLHNGAAKIGDFIIEDSGRIVLVDPETGNPRLIFSAQSIALLEDLLSTSDFGNSASGIAYNNILPGNPITLATVYGVKNGSTITFEAGNLEVTANNAYNSNPSVGTTFKIELLRNGSYYATIKSIFVPATVASQTITTAISYRLTGAPSGSYYSARISVVASASTVSASAKISPSILTWSFQQSGIRNFMFGLNGFFSFFSDRHAYFSEEKGWDLKGPTNMPGMLAAASVVSNGTQGNGWGAKLNSIGAGIITGGYRVPLKDMKHNIYTVQITPHTATTFRLGAKTSTYFEVFITGGFDYMVAGENYA